MDRMEIEALARQALKERRWIRMLAADGTVDGATSYVVLEKNFAAGVDLIEGLARGRKLELADSDSLDQRLKALGPN